VPTKGDRREGALLDAAESLLESGDFASVSVADLAERADISRATFYFYFASKQALLGAVVARAVHDLEQRLIDQSDPQAGTPAERVTRTVQAAADLWHEHRAVLLASVELGTTMPEVYDRGMSSIAAVADLTLGVLRAAGHEAATVEPERTEQLVTALVLMSERNFYDLARTSTVRADYQRLAAVLALIWLRALGLEPG
jgi:TetR/AcrR family transcriptional regulator, ethionamide resistance regulator